MKKLSLLKLGKSPAKQVHTIYAYTAVTHNSLLSVLRTHSKSGRKTQEAYIKVQQAHQRRTQKGTSMQCLDGTTVTPASGDAQGFESYYTYRS